MKKILLVEDDPYIRDITAKRLEERDMTVVVASNGQAALEAMSEAPDLVITDLDIPNMDGSELLRALKITHPQVPVIVFSNNDSPEMAELLVAEGAKEFFNKSKTDIEQLVALINRHTK
jgi:two-component system, OmpR family, KDP operon response regulator KdpE